MKMPIIMILRMIIILCIVTTNCADHIRLDDMTILSVFFINHHNLSPTPSHVGKLCCSSYTGQRDICVFISTGCIAFHKPRMEWNYFDSSWTPQEQKKVHHSTTSCMLGCPNLRFSVKLSAFPRPKVSTYHMPCDYLNMKALCPGHPD